MPRTHSCTPLLWQVCQQMAMKHVTYGGLWLEMNLIENTWKIDKRSYVYQ